MARSFGVWTTGFFLASAGCLGGGAADPLPIPTGPPGLPDYDANATFAVAYNATGCREGIVLALVSFEQAARSLPPGFTPRDAQSALGLPIASGSSAVFLNANGCTNSELAVNGIDEGAVGVYVNPPAVEGVEPVQDTFYEVARWTTKDEALHLFRSIGWNAMEGRPTIALQPLTGGGNTGTGDVKNDEGIVQHTLGMTAPSSEEGSFSARFWHDTPTGLAYVEYSGTTTVASGSGSCGIRAGPARDALGAAACESGRTFSLAIPNFAWESRIVNLPNVTLG